MACSLFSVWSVFSVASPRPDDWVATATAFTARSIAVAYRRFLLRPRSSQRADGSRRSGRIHGVFRGSSAHFELIACGGGAKNPLLMSLLRRELPQADVRIIGDFAIPSEAKEAVSFAMMAKAFIDGMPANLPQVTGAARPVVMGRLVEP